MEHEEYERRFIAHMKGQGVDYSMAKEEYSAWMDSYAVEALKNGTPELDADEVMSYWD